MNFHAISVAATGARATTGAASATVAIPTAANGATPRYVRICSEGNVFVRPVAGATDTAANTDILVTQYAPVILNVHGYSYIAHIQDGSAIAFNVTPIEA